MRPLRRILATLTASVAVAVTGLAYAQPAQAAPIDLVFANTTGTTFIAKQKVTAEIPTSVVKTSIDLDAKTLTGSAQIPDLTVHLKLAGLIPTTSIVRIVPQGGLTGTVDLGANKLSTTTTFKLQVLKVFQDALPKLNLVSNGCISKTATSATLTNTTPIDIFSTTTVSGSYTIPAFTKCGLLTPLLTTLLAGGGNTLTLNLKG
jgi:nicotinamide mononucleotide (NMN) deamidase PncC